MYLAIESRSAWESTLHFTAAFLGELRFWYCNIDSFNSYSLRPPLDSSTVIFSDANDVGFGGFSDRFATYYNAQLLRFNSKFASPRCSGMDALAQHRSTENDWMCPPVRLIVDSVRHLKSSSGSGTLIVPEWPSAYFWPSLRERFSRFKSFAWMCLPCLQLTIYCWRGRVRSRYIRLALLFFVLPEVQNASFALRF